ncbi:mitochondrial fission factor homolog B-like isoform X1 [Denticeps clupeoides]|uniref:mitochondrial fission factor homolog B-like isoform X1 n=1 Tax=Denticeps clupeoides TaxID=299321 RepID=UPI0010A4F041|nr:mitochondrial fission factor homolog B-like isoform X1 [Denticeps clupeoides]
MAAPVYLGEGVAAHGRDPSFTEAISQRMRVPNRLRVGVGLQIEEDRHRPEDLPPAYSMHIPERLALTDAPDISPRPLFSKQSSGFTSSAWDLHQGAWDKDSAYLREPLQSPLRRSYSDQTFGRTPPGTPTYTKQALHAPMPNRSSGRPSTPLQRGADPPAASKPQELNALQPSLLSPQSVLQAAKELGQQASKRFLQTVTQKYSSSFGCPDSPNSSAVEVPSQGDPGRKSAMQESWLSPEEESGVAVEFIVLRRQVLKLSRRLAALERQNAERRQTELVLFSLLVSTCLVNVWLWMRR